MAQHHLFAHCAGRLMCPAQYIHKTLHIVWSSNPKRKNLMINQLAIGVFVVICMMVVSVLAYTLPGKLQNMWDKGS